MGVFRDRCVGGGWICGLETKAEVGTRDTNLRVIYTAMRAEALGRDKAAKEGSLDKEERPETDSYGMCVYVLGVRGEGDISCKSIRNNIKYGKMPQKTQEQKILAKGGER